MYRSSSPAPLTVALAAGAVLLILSSCPWDSPGTDWSDFRDVNLLVNQSFGSQDPDGSPWVPMPGLTVETGGAVDFLRWERLPDPGDPGAVAPPGGAVPDEAVYRLEVPNLFQNGDFEEDSLPGWWSATGAAAANPSLVDEPSDRISLDPIGGVRSLGLNFDGAAARYAANLEEALTDGFPQDVPQGEDVSYAFHLDYRLESDQFRLELNNNAPGTNDPLQEWLLQPQTPGDNLIYSFPGNSLTGDDGKEIARPANSNTLNRIAGTPQYFSFNSVSTPLDQDRIQGVFDNIRFVREQPHYLVLEVPYSQEGRPDLVGEGSFRFHLYVRKDPTVNDPVDGRNRFPARFISAGLVQAASAAALPAGAAAEKKELPVDDGDGWELLEWTFSGVNVPFQVQPGETAFFLVVEPGYSGDPRYLDAGSVLVAAPRLYWSP
ncbi:hypothetical protein AU468_08775 [Alkalispirochaeta sphaeroplastigenens]|uniref:Uncharacterized protein n=1 Tax=Alkalispirochaeta sphaeroplastigenens TaxID=1187066 RepID=A0A2S4JNQ6_9SPIO|nr:hypothetical protein [Alkalispirochaeta sphaeroplastigenens]POR01132.1 hypothetical protein AU468_08775 [Alkalispirochaeta sphaeroplastigenens]